MSFGGNLGGGGFFGGPNSYGPGGPYGVYPGCGCGSFVMILAILLFLFGGCLRSVGF